MNAPLKMPVTVDDLRKFNGSVDERRFKAALAEFLRDHGAPLDQAEVVSDMRRRAAAQRCDAWQPSESELARGRAAQLARYNASSNLPIARFAELDNRSRQQIYNDIHGRKLLAIRAGSGAQRLPDWQLLARPRALTAAVLAQASDIDAWTAYDALTSNYEQFGDAPAVEVARAADPATLELLRLAVLDRLGYR